MEGGRQNLRVWRWHVFERSDLIRRGSTASDPPINYTNGKIMCWPCVFTLSNFSCVYVYVILTVKLLALLRTSIEESMIQQVYLICSQDSPSWDRNLCDGLILMHARVVQCRTPVSGVWHWTIIAIGLKLCGMLITQSLRTLPLNHAAPWNSHYNIEPRRYIIGCDKTAFSLTVGNFNCPKCGFQISMKTHYYN